MRLASHPKAQQRLQPLSTPARRLGLRSLRQDWVGVALWLGFFGLFVRGFGQSIGGIRHTGRFLFDMCAVVLIFASLPQLVRHVRRPWAWQSASWCCTLFLGFSTLAAFVGLVYRNDFITWVVMGFLPFMSASCMVLGEEPKLFEKLTQNLVHQLCFGALFALYIFIFDRPFDRLEWAGPFGDGLAKMAGRSLYALPFVLPSLGLLKPFYRALLVFCWFASIGLQVMGANRGPVLTLVLILPMLIGLTWFKHPKARQWIPRLGIALAIVMLIVAPLLNLAIANNPDFLTYVVSRGQETLGRFVGGAEHDDVFMASQSAWRISQEEFLGHTSRGGELRDFFQQLEPIDWVCGRGFGGSWMSTFWGVPWKIVHVGPAHLILIGGLPLLMVFVVLVVKALFEAWSAIHRHPAAAGCFCYIVCFGVGFIQHGVLQDDNELFLFWLSLGLAYACGNSTRKRCCQQAHQSSLRRQPRMQALACP